jgi:hypothetical protein
MVDSISLPQAQLKSEPAPSELAFYAAQSAIAGLAVRLSSTHLRDKDRAFLRAYLRSELPPWMGLDEPPIVDGRAKPGFHLEVERAKRAYDSEPGRAFRAIEDAFIAFDYQTDFNGVRSRFINADNDEERQAVLNTLRRAVTKLGEAASMPTDRRPGVEGAGQ